MISITEVEGYVCTCMHTNTCTLKGGNCLLLLLTKISSSKCALDPILSYLPKILCFLLSAPSLVSLHLTASFLTVCTHIVFSKFKSNQNRTLFWSPILLQPMPQFSATVENQTSKSCQIVFLFSCLFHSLFGWFLCLKVAPGPWGLHRAV